MAITWSYSSIKNFQQCPKKYYHLNVAKDIKESSNTALVYGNEVHKAAEKYIKNNEPLPQSFAYIQDVLDALNRIPGEKHCELRLGLAKEGEEYKPCEFFSDNVWWRGIVDLLIVQKDVAFMIDYKTSKNAKYADTKQLDLLATAIFVHFPEVNQINSALIFVVSNEFVKRTHFRDGSKSYIAPFEYDVTRIEDALQSGVWNAVAGPLCGWCPVKTCINYKEPRR